MTAGERRTISFDYLRLPSSRTTFHGNLLHIDDHLLVMEQTIKRGSPLVVDGQEVVATGYNSVWYLWKGRAYDVARFHRPDGTLTGYYVDALEPVSWQGADPTTLAPLVDLFLDLWITPSGDAVLLDEDELAAAEAAGVVSPRQSVDARATLEGLAAEVLTGTFPPAEVRLHPLRPPGR